MSWLHRDGGYDLLCNRDEKRTRTHAHPPRISARSGVHYVAPVDPAGGGTWIAANQYGLALCLLNGRPDTGQPAGARASRGLLIPALVSSRTAAEACARVRGFDLSRFAPFTLVVLSPGNPAAVIGWDGSHASFFSHGEPEMLLVSSSFDPDGVEARRRDEWRQALAAGPDAVTLSAYHAGHGTGPDAYSTCMHRPDAETVSFSRVTVTRSQTRLFYSPGAPCLGKPGVTRTLSLR